MSEKLNPFGSAVSDLRSRMNLSQGEVARRSKGGKRKGITAAYVSLIESGQVLPETLTVKTLNALAHGLNLPATLLFAIATGGKKASETLEEIAAYAKMLSKDRQKDILLIAKAFYHDSGEFIEEEILRESDIEELVDVDAKKLTDF